MERLQIIDTEVPLLEPPQSDNDARRRILYVLYVLFKHKLLMTIAFLVVSLPILIVILVMPEEYVATAKVLIKSNRTYLNLSPAGGGSPLVLYPSPETINSEIQIIQSRELIGRLAKEAPYPEKDKTMKMVWRLKATPVRLTNLIAISLRSPDPDWAVRAVNRAADIYLDQHLDVHKTRGVEEFYDEQEKKLQMELTKAEMALKEFQEKEKIVDAEVELASDLGRLAAFETSLRNTESSIRESKERIRILEAQLKEQQPTPSSSKQVSGNPQYDKVRDKLIQLELERDSLLQRYTANDRLVKDKEKEIADLNNTLAKMLSDPKAVWSTNPVHQGILNSLLKERAELTALEGRRNSLQRQVTTYSSQAADLKKKSFAYDRLRQDVNSRKEALALYKRRAEEARISDAMDERKFGNVAIFEKASLPLPPAGYSSFLLVLATLLVSMGIAVAGAFAIEFFNTTLRDETDVEEQIGVPVLATIQDYGS